MVLRRFRKEVVLAGFAAEAQAPMVVTDKTELSTTIRTAVLRLGHDALLGSQASARWRISLRRLTSTPSALRLPATQRCAGGQVSTLHCREMSAELTFGNQVNAQQNSAHSRESGDLSCLRCGRDRRRGWR